MSGCRKDWRNYFALVSLGWLAVPLTPAEAHHVETKIWNGRAFINNLWSDPNNWTSIQAPSPGNEVDFPSVGSAVFTSFNNLPDGMLIDLISFTGAGYEVRGNPIVLKTGFDISHGPGVTTFYPDVTCSNAQTFVVTLNGALFRLMGALDLQYNAMTVRSVGGTTFAGNLRGTGSITKSGNGRLELTGNNTNYSGTITVGAGTVIIDAQQPDSKVFVNQIGTLGGTGRVKSISANGGTILPGGSGVGILTVAGAVNFSFGTAFNATINGPRPGLEHDQLVCGGPLSLGGTVLNLTWGYEPAGFDIITLINNIGTNAVVGTFKDLPNGALLTVGNTVRRICYTGGDGNDVVLTPVDTPPLITSLAWTDATVVSIMGFGPTDAIVRLDASDNFVEWTPILTNVADACGWFRFLDTDTNSFLYRFYRIAVP